MKIRSVGAELFHLDGRTDITKLIVAFRNFADAPKKGKCKLKINLLPLSICVSLCPLFRLVNFLSEFTKLYEYYAIREYPRTVLSDFL
jgi:hypothetical protein